MKKILSQNPCNQGEAIDACLKSSNFQPIRLHSAGFVTPTHVAMNHVSLHLYQPCMNLSGVPTSVFNIMSNQIHLDLKIINIICLIGLYNLHNCDTLCSLKLSTLVKKNLKTLFEIEKKKILCRMADVDEALGNCHIQKLQWMAVDPCIWYRWHFTARKCNMGGLTLWCLCGGSLTKTLVWGFVLCSNSVKISPVVLKELQKVIHSICFLLLRDGFFDPVVCDRNTLNDLYSFDIQWSPSISKYHISTSAVLLFCGFLKIVK